MGELEIAGRGVGAQLHDLGAALQALGAGQLTPEETATVAGAIEVQRRSLEVADLERRIEALEQARAEEEETP
jgi:ubiquinone biosynthesis protein UbiJ